MSNKAQQVIVCSSQPVRYAHSDLLGMVFHIRYRLICCYHGMSALIMAFIWHLIDNNRSCSKRITDFELLMLV
jgi:hypothetical protein